MTLIVEDMPRSKERALARQYDLTKEEFEQLLVIQDRRCATCRRRFTGLLVPQVDHDHRNGFVRGLLCARCNYDVLGHLGDDAGFYEAVANYLVQAPGDQLRDGEGVRVPGAPPLWVLEG